MQSMGALSLVERTGDGGDIAKYTHQISILRLEISGERGWIIESERESYGCAIPTFDQRRPLNKGRVLV